MPKKIIKELSLILIMALTATLLTGCSDITKITLNENGSGVYEETASVSKTLWDLAVTEAGNDEIFKTYFQTMYPQAEVRISDQTIGSTPSKIVEAKMNFKDSAEFSKILSSSNITSVKFNRSYFTRVPVYMPLEEDDTDQTSAADELMTLLGSDESLSEAIAAELKNIEIKTTITFPYTVTKTNGELQEDGKTVVWDLQKMDRENRLYALFQISNSLKAPAYTGASNGKNYNTGVTLLVNSDNLLEKVKVNGETTQSDYLFLSAEGIYHVTATDINGNSSNIKFRIDTTKPSVSGVVNGKTYKDVRTIRFSDKGSGIKKAVLNGKTVKTGKKVSKKGRYTLIVTDKAGNQKTIKFKIK